MSLLSQVNIRIKIENNEDTLFYLLKYKSDKSHIIIDTSSVSAQTKVFKNKNKYQEGIYVLADSKQHPLFEFLIGKDQKFSIQVKELMDLNTYKVKACKETSDYFKVYSRTFHDNLYIKALENELRYFPDNLRKIDSVKNELYDYQESMLTKDVSSFLNTYIKFIEEVVVPQEFKDNSEQYIIDHYFDNLPLQDDRILNSRLLKNKLDYYFDNYMSSQTPEVICEKINHLIDMINGRRFRGVYIINTDVRDYTLWYLYSRYFNPENVENELVYVYLVDNYFTTYEIKNLTDNIRNEIIKRANVLRKITIGKIAPAISYIDDDGNEINLKDVDSENIILFFYKPDCQNCIKGKRILSGIEKKNEDTKILYINISEDNHYNVSQDIVNQYDIMMIPTIYILNREKKIIAKNIKVEDIEFHLIKR